MFWRGLQTYLLSSKELYVITICLVNIHEAPTVHGSRPWVYISEQDKVPALLKLTFWRKKVDKTKYIVFFLWRKIKEERDRK